MASASVLLPQNLITNNDFHKISRIPVWNFRKDIIPPINTTNSISSDETSIKKVSRKGTRKLKSPRSRHRGRSESKMPPRNIPKEMILGKLNGMVDENQAVQFERNKFGYNRESLRGKRIVLPDIRTKIPKLTQVPTPPVAPKVTKAPRPILPSIPQQQKPSDFKDTLFLPTSPRCPRQQNELLKSRVSKLEAFLRTPSPGSDRELQKLSFKRSRRLLPKIRRDGFESKIPRWDKNIKRTAPNATNDQNTINDLQVEKPLLPPIAMKPNPAVFFVEC